jgi:hypothetical protein
MRALLIIKYDGQEYPFDMDDITVQQALAIEKYMGGSFAEWGKKLQEGGDLRARQVLGWLILHPEHDGQDLSVLVKAIGDTNFKMVRLGDAIDEAFTAEAAKQEQDAGPVPTVAASTGQTPAAASSPVS